jgi:hypothetical protein
MQFHDNLWPICALPLKSPMYVCFLNLKIFSFSTLSTFNLEVQLGFSKAMHKWAKGCHEIAFTPYD